jgi:AraC-like DNA-binding protein
MIHPSTWLEAMVLAIAGFNLMLVFVKILFSKSQVPQARMLLLAWFFGMAVGMLMLFLMDTELILHVPWLYRMPSPGYYLIFPAAYLYLRMILTNNSRLTRWDALHLMPALLHFLELLPFYLKPNAYKLEVVQAVLSKPLGAFAQGEGLLAQHQNLMLIGVFGLGYTFAMFRLMRITNKAEHAAVGHVLKMRRLLWVFIFLQLIFAITPIVLLGFPQLGLEDVRGTLLYVTLAITQLGAAVLFIFYPDLQNGVYDFEEEDNSPTDEAHLQNQSKTVAKDISTLQQIGLNATERSQNLRKDLEEHLNKNKSFLNKNINLIALASQLNVTADQLLHVLNKEIGLRFSDYINLMRIEYMEARIIKEDLKKYTLETIALESGFNTRITFIRATTKLKGCSPKVYFRTVTKQHKMMKLKEQESRNSEKLKKHSNFNKV